MTRIHTVPVNDLRGHVTDDALCPRMPRMLERGQIVVHNSYDAREVGEVCRNALNKLGLALSEHGHTWTAEQRSAYEHAILVLDMHWPT